MSNGFYNNYKVSSVIEFICSNKINVSIVNMNVYYILSKIYDLPMYDIYITLKKLKYLIRLIQGFFINHFCDINLNYFFMQGPVLTAEENQKFIFQWFTPLVCPNHQHIKNREIINNYSKLKPTYIQIDELNYTIYICPKNNNDVNYNYNSGTFWNMISRSWLYMH